MAKHVTILLHSEDSGFADRRDLAIAINGRIRHIFTIGVNNGGTCGTFHHPFRKGDTLGQMWSLVEKYNKTPQGAVCLCGARQEYHTHSAACEDYSHVSEIDIFKAMDWALRAKRKGIRDQLNKLLLDLYIQGA